MAYDVNKVINIANAEVGYLEKETNSNLDSKTANAGDMNYTKYWRDIYPSYQRNAWCLCFVVWCFKQAYGDAIAKKLLCMTNGYTFYTPTSANYFKKNGQWYTKPQVGDLIFFKNSVRICHVGLVYKVTSTTVYTVEGNTSGASGVIANGGGVCKKSYAIGYSRIAGYGRPNYGGAVISTTTSVTTKSYLSKGDKGSDVKELQTNLNKLGYNCGTVDGNFGAKTDSAVKAFQKDKKLTVDGKVGSATKAKIEECLKALTNTATSSQGFKSLYVDTGKKGMLVTTALNYRTKPVDGTAKGTLKKGQYVFPTERTEGGAFPSYWFKVNGYWCSGKYLDGWVLDKTANKWWYNEKGAYIKSEWKQIDGTWYYFKSDGYMASNAYVKSTDKNVWYYVNKDGAWITSKDVTVKPSNVVK